MHLTMDQIEILEDEIPNDKLESIFNERYGQSKKASVADNTDNLIPWVFYDPITRYSHIVSSSTIPVKENVRFYNHEDPDRLILLKGRPVYPIQIGGDGLPIIEEYFIK